ncbi:hypothetical protein PENTCL1PPCAC_6898, partial [Pristionchus entomophagus]
LILFPFSLSRMGRFSLNGSRGFYSFQHDPLPSTLPTSPNRPIPSFSPSYSCLSLRSRLLAVIQLLLIACSATIVTQRILWNESPDYLFLCFVVIFLLPSAVIVWMVMKCEYSSGSCLSSRSRDCSMLLSLLSFAFLLTSLLLFIHQDFSAGKEKERPLLSQLTKDLLFYGLSSLLYLLCTSSYSSLHSHYNNLVFSTLRTRNTLPNRFP